MANAIEVIGNTFQVKARGMTITVKPHDGEWLVLVDNASARAWNRGRESFKVFATLEAVEAKYKSLRGLVELSKALEEAEEVEAAPVAVEAPIAAPAASVSVVDTVKAIAKRHGVYCRQLRLKRGIMRIGRQTEWLSRETFEALVADLQKVKGIRIQQLETLRDSAKTEIKAGRVMVDTIGIGLLN
ncbi:MAG: hypothetical protein ACRC2Y_04370 [Aeromonas veronii]